MSANILTIKLNNGIKMPILGLDTSQDLESDESGMCQRIKNAIDIGYRLFDCANNPSIEKAIGKAFQEKMQQKIVRREDLFIICKLEIHDQHLNLVEVSVLKKLHLLKLSYIDLFLIYWPMGFYKDDKGCDIDYIDIWKIMENLYKKNVVRALGVANFSNQQIQNILNIATVVPQISQIECNYFINQQKHRSFCEKQGIKVCCFLSFRKNRNTCDTNILQDNRIQEIALRYGKTATQILLKYNLQLENIIVFSVTEEYELLAIVKDFDFYLAPEDMSYINSFNCV